MTLHPISFITFFLFLSLSLNFHHPLLTLPSIHNLSPIPSTHSSRMAHQYYHQDHHQYDQEQPYHHHPQQSNYPTHHPHQYIDRYAEYDDQLAPPQPYSNHLPIPPDLNQTTSSSAYHHSQPPPLHHPYPVDEPHLQHSTYPPDQYYHPEENYHPDYDPAYGLDEKYPPGDLYPPPTSRPLHEAPVGISHFNSTTSTLPSSPTRGSVAAQMAAEGVIPEKAGLRMWRSDEHSGAFTRGGKSRSCGRCCGCASIIILLTVLGIIAGFLLWVRPPNATFNGIAPPTAGNQVDLQPNGFLLNFDLNIGVTNPNFFGASFSKISAKAYYPLNKTAALGGGELENVEIKPHSNTTINFPFQINYTTSLDPNRAILADIASRCGFLGSPKSPIKISFDIMLRLKILAITISPTFSSSNTFTCPLKQSDFTSVLGPTQSLDALANLLTGSGGGGGGAAAGAAAAIAGGGGGGAKKRFVKRSTSDDDQEIDQDEEDRQIEELVMKVLRAGSSNLSSPHQLRLSSISVNGLSLPFTSLSSLSSSSSSTTISTERYHRLVDSSILSLLRPFRNFLSRLCRSLIPSSWQSLLHGLSTRLP